MSIYSVKGSFKPFRCWSPQVVFQEVPDHISLAFTVSGCPLQCDGCHSQDTWDMDSGHDLSNDDFIEYLRQYRGLVTCVLFFGGEWWPDSLIEKLKIARQMGLHTCLYSGFERVPNRISRHLDFLKLGPWRADLGGLTEPTTNQRFYDVKTGICLNHRFSQSPLGQAADLSETEPFRASTSDSSVTVSFS